MRTVVAQDIVSSSKFNRFHLLVFIWCFYAIGFDGFDIAMYGVGLPWMMEEWNLSALQAGAVGSYSLFGMMIGALVLAPVADKFGRKNVIIICMFLFSAFTLAAGLSHNITLVHGHALYCRDWDGRVDAKLYFTYDRVFTEKKSCPSCRSHLYWVCS